MNSVRDDDRFPLYWRNSWCDIPFHHNRPTGWNVAHAIDERSGYFYISAVNWRLTRRREAE